MELLLIVLLLLFLGALIGFGGGVDLWKKRTSAKSRLFHAMGLCLIFLVVLALDGYEAGIALPIWFVAICVSARLRALRKEEEVTLPS